MPRLCILRYIIGVINKRKAVAPAQSLNFSVNDWSTGASQAAGDTSTAADSRLGILGASWSSLP